MMSLETRFWKNVERRPAACWIWKGTKKTGRSNYGIIRNHGRPIRAHRLSYQLHFGEIPKGMFVCHHCDTPSCVNPDHLFLGTAKDNSRDMMSKGRNMHVTKPGTLARGDRNGTRTKPETVRRGEKIEWSKLTAAKVTEIRDRFARGEAAASLATEFKVYFGTIYKAIYGYTWKHVKSCPHIPRCFENSDGCWNYDEAKKRVDAYPNFP